MKNKPERHVIFDKTSAKPAPPKNLFSSFFHYLCAGWLKLGGWTMEGDWPDLPKMVLIAAPHTSNWDGINMLAAAGYYRVKIRWMGKKSLTTGVFGGIVKWLGCVPVDRSSNHDLVQQMVDAFSDTDRMILVIPPEGTRAKTRGWKTGFYHIAHKAEVPIIIAVLDYGSKTIRVSGNLTPSGDYKADLDHIKTHYQGAQGRYGGDYVIDAG